MSSLDTNAPEPRKSLWSKHKIFETNSIILVIGVLLVVSIGGLVEIAPLFYLRNTIETVEGMRPYTPLELAGRAIYVREGCYNCHSQMIRPLRDEIERYGHYSLAAESMYDKPFQWGSKRTGPDLARVGGKYSDEWQLAHLNRPRDLVPQSIMPGYPFLAATRLNYGDIADHLRANRAGGVPYSDEMIAQAETDLKAQATPDHPRAAELEARHPKVQIRDFDGDAQRISEADALIAYLQTLGTLVDFKIYDDKANIR
ncbi:cytochrome-c oxidase, cbb3-type subunit II [Bosea sp. BK604]|uniref:cytochrome-c oxidase, cbb3-type subunit II n=1 Tax=Bosea sp. BK604 TaxID=2512180 RepID=UPI001047A58B|nr:cytochrome-c oxidase, cbb3-type subunit II [Bosea sp. BK604]TCR61752.1 cytochrome c oxidase cbb3-type subunit 2 [Bosea sp. BK604]